MGDDSIDTVILNIDMGYIVTLWLTLAATPSTRISNRHFLSYHAIVDFAGYMSARPYPAGWNYGALTEKWIG